jgi:hypothetical protein
MPWSFRIEGGWPEPLGDNPALQSCHSGGPKTVLRSTPNGDASDDEARESHGVRPDAPGLAARVRPARAG